MRIQPAVVLASVLASLLSSCAARHHDIFDDVASAQIQRQEDIKTIEDYQKRVLNNPNLFELISRMDKSIWSSNRVRLAVFLKAEHTGGASGWPESKNLQESLYNGFVQKILKAYRPLPAFQLVERQNLEAILKEQKLSYTGVLSGSPVEAGKILNTTHLMYIDIFVESPDIVENVKLVDSATGELVGAYSERSQP